MTVLLSQKGRFVCENVIGAQYFGTLTDSVRALSLSYIYITTHINVYLDVEELN